VDEKIWMFGDEVWSSSKANARLYIQKAERQETKRPSVHKFLELSQDMAKKGYFACAR
jgi:hypothetical protein